MISVFSLSALMSSIFRLAQRWAPVLFWTAGIFYFSSRPDPLGFLPSSEQDALDIGNLAHVGEYAGLAALLYRALRKQGRGGDKERGRGGEDLLVSLSSCLLFAILDELHQGLVPGRGFELADIGYDLAGTSAALGLIWMRERGRMDGGEG